jgi:hypothetical protein
MKPVVKLEGPTRPKRASLAMLADVICANAETYSAPICNLSSKGFKIESGAPLRLCDHLDLQIGAERASAQIKWVAGSKAGGEFAGPVMFPD